LVAGSALLLGQSLFQQGRLDEAESLTATAAAVATSLPGDLWTRAELYRLQSLLCAHRGAYEEATRLARDAVETAAKVDSPTLQADTLMNAAEALELAGRGADARDALERALEVYEQKEHLVGAERARAALASRAAG
jgi:tetratricopeptide (TPR) repeat protein